MQEFILLIRNSSDHQIDMTPDVHLEFVNKCRDLIGELKQEGKLISAQPMMRQGAMISNINGEWRQGPFAESEEVIAGYYHILANDLDDAITIAKRNPEFAYGTTARIEVRALKMSEQKTGFVYPTH